MLARCQAAFQGRVSSFEGLWPDFYRVMTGPGWFTPPPPRDHPYYALVEIKCVPDEEPRFLAVLEAAMADGSVRDAMVAASKEQRRSLWRIRESVEVLVPAGRASVA